MEDLAKVKRNVSKMVDLGAPESDIDAYISSEGTSIDEIKNFKSDNRSFTGDVKQAYNERVGMAQDAAEAYSQGKQTLPETYLQVTGKGVAGLASDVVGAGLSATGRGLSNITPDFIEKPLVQGAKDVFNYAKSTPAGVLVGDKINQAAQSYNKFAENNPRAARNIEATLNIGNYAGVLTPIKGQSAVGMALKPVTAIADKGRGMVNAISDRAAYKSMAKPLTKAKQDFKLGKKLYAASEIEDVQFSPENLTALNKNLSSLIPKTHAEKMNWSKGKAFEHVNDLQETMKVEPLTLNGALSQRNRLNDDINTAYRAGRDKEADNLMKVKDALDDTMYNPDTKNWQEANYIWGKASVKQDLENMVRAAEDKAQPANSLDKAISTYLRKKDRTLSEQEKKALRDVIGKGWIKEAGKNLSGRLISHVATVVGAGVGGVGGAVVGNLVGTYGSMFARDLTMMNKLKKLDKFFELVDSRPMKTVSKVKEEIPKKQLLLPAPDKNKAIQMKDKRMNDYLEKYNEKLTKGDK